VQRVVTAFEPIAAARRLSQRLPWSFAAHAAQMAARGASGLHTAHAGNPHAAYVGAYGAAGRPRRKQAAYAACGFARDACAHLRRMTGQGSVRPGMGEEADLPVSEGKQFIENGFLCSTSDVEIPGAGIRPTTFTANYREKDREHPNLAIARCQTLMRLPSLAEVQEVRVILETIFASKTDRSGDKLAVLPVMQKASPPVDGRSHLVHLQMKVGFPRLGATAIRYRKMSSTTPLDT
jgi:hypothetical protein